MIPPSLMIRIHPARTPTSGKPGMGKQIDSKQIHFIDSFSELVLPFQEDFQV